VALTRDNPEAHGQFLNNVQDWYEDELQQQQPVTPLSPALGGSDNASSIGISEHYDDAGPGDNRKATPV
jgi:hypothetical protein